MRWTIVKIGWNLVNWLNFGLGFWSASWVGRGGGAGFGKEGRERVEPSPRPTLFRRGSLGFWRRGLRSERESHQASVRAKLRWGNVTKQLLGHMMWYRGLWCGGLIQCSVVRRENGFWVCEVLSLIYGWQESWEVEDHMILDRWLKGLLRGGGIWYFRGSRGGPCNGLPGDLSASGFVSQMLNFVAHMKVRCDFRNSNMQAKISSEMGCGGESDFICLEICISSWNSRV